MGLTPGGGSAVHMYTQTVHRTIKLTRTTQLTTKTTQLARNKPKEYVGESGFKRAVVDAVDYLSLGRQQLSYGPKRNYGETL